MAESTVLSHKCPNCGGPLLFEPKSQKFHCDYCLSSFTEAEVLAFEQKEKDAKVAEPSVEAAADSQNSSAEEETSAEGVGLFVCPSCGAEIVTDATTASTFCYYCHNPVVLSERISGKYLPEKVLPFQIERKAAEEQFLAWVGKKHFVPKEFFNKKQIQNLSGVYFPYWVVKADLAGELNADAMNLRVWVVGDIEYTETKQYQILRRGTTAFSDLVKNALRKNEPEKMVSAVQPFDLATAIPFKNQYLSGFLAEKRDIEFDELQDKVNQDLQQYATALMQDTIGGYTSISNVRSNQNVTSLDKAYVLLPIWLVTYREANSKKLFYYAMNGQTGKVAGILPIDKRKLTLTAMIMFVALLLLGLAVGWLTS